MKILVAIASYGMNNDAYLARLLAEYGRLHHAVDVVVVSNIEKEVGAGVEVVVGLPTSDPWSLPFAHKTIFAQRLEDYDLFIYSEDDTLVTQENIDAFLWATSILEPDELAGFMRSEEGPDGALHYSTIHNHYHWDVRSACRRQGETFVHFTNEHSACYLLTRDQLRRAIASGGFCVPPHQGRYDLLVSAATDPYTQCGFRKLVCVSRLREFTVRHLTNKYIGRIGVAVSLVELQVRTLIDIAGASDPPPASIRSAPRLAGTRWIKSYYEPCREDLVALVPESARTVLSIGCGWGSTEEALLRKHLDVSAIPLDTVIGQVAASRGVRIVPWCLEAAPAHLAEASFDVLLIPGLLHLLDDPVGILRSYRPLLSEDGVVIATCPNLRHASVWRRRLLRAPDVADLADHRRSGVHVTGLSVLRRWLHDAGFERHRSLQQLNERWRRYHLGTLGLFGRVWASEFTVVAHARRNRRYGLAPSGGVGSRIHHAPESPGTSGNLGTHALRQGTTRPDDLSRDGRIVRPTKVLLLGVTLGSDNRGIGALAMGAIAIVSRRYPDCEIRFVDYGVESSTTQVPLGDRIVSIPLINLRFSKKLWLSNNVARLLVLAWLARIAGGPLRKRVIARNPWLKDLADADIALAVSGGDSFSDIYGLSRFIYMSLPQLLVLALGRPLVLMPQTIGPMRSWLARRIARHVLDNARVSFTRDADGVATIARNLKLDPQKTGIRFAYDMGFLLEPTRPGAPDLRPDDRPGSRRRPRVGLNVSGLLSMGGYDGKNMFSLRCDYAELVERLIVFLIESRQADVLLIPHVFGSAQESDVLAIDRVYAKFKDRYPAHLNRVAATHDQGEIKYIIGTCELFIGSRMHACIAALSQGVPAVGIAYSPKFLGVLASIGAGELVADPRTLSADRILDMVDRVFLERTEIRHRLEQSMPAVRAKTRDVLADIACAAAE